MIIPEEKPCFFSRLIIYIKLFRLLAAGLVPFLNLGGFVPLLATSTVTDPAVLAAADSLVVAGGKFWSKAYATGKVFDGSGWVYTDGTSGGTVDPTYTSQPSPTPSGNNGWDGSTYYLNGTASTLDSTGSGFNTSDETYYINGLATTLDKDGNGWGLTGNLCVNGVDTGTATGWDPTSNSYYIDAAWTSLDQTGSGYDTESSAYYIAGQRTSLDQYGNGFDLYRNTFFANGQTTGWDNSNNAFVYNGMQVDWRGADLSNNPGINGYVLNQAMGGGLFASWGIFLPGYEPGAIGGGLYGANLSGNDLTGWNPNGSDITGMNLSYTKGVTAEMIGNSMWSYGLNLTGLNITQDEMLVAIQQYSPNPWAAWGEVDSMTFGDFYKDGVYYVNGVPQP